MRFLGWGAGSAEGPQGTAEMRNIQVRQLSATDSIVVARFVVRLNFLLWYVGLVDSVTRGVISGLVDLELRRKEDFARDVASNSVFREEITNCNCEEVSGYRCVEHQKIVERYEQYRDAWRGSPQKAFNQKTEYSGYSAIQDFPLCIDIEIAAVCDLACPFCFRQSLITPDKLMKLEDYKEIIKQVGELGVPSVKLNWRGEPLLHPQIFEMIKLAKKEGVLEVIINTNATKLDEVTSKRLIDSGLDRMIYSFDGGTKETYEKMRPGRFSKNTFEAVYQNIVRFKKVREEVGSKWPRTQIQMIVTEETKKEQIDFIQLFQEHVDFVSVKPYTERGGALSELPEDSLEKIKSVKNELGIEGKTEVRWDIEGNLYVSTGRLPCEQPFQRLMITYDGVVSMCCYDWGSSYPVGYVLDRALESSGDYNVVSESILKEKRGFELMSNARMPKQLNEIAKTKQSVKEIWDGKEVEKVRKAHVSRNLKSISICAGCKFKETFSWKKIEV